MADDAIFFSLKYKQAELGQGNMSVGWSGWGPGRREEVLENRGKFSKTE